MMQKYRIRAKADGAVLEPHDDGICYLASEVDAAMKKKDEELAYCYEENRKTGMDSVRWAQLAGDNQRKIAALKAERDGYVKAHRETEMALMDENTRQAEEIERLREALGALGIAADKVHKVMNVIQPFLKVFMEHGMLIADCMTQAALTKTEVK